VISRTCSSKTLRPIFKKFGTMDYVGDLTLQAIFEISLIKVGHGSHARGVSTFNQRIKFRLATVAHNIINSSQPAYLHFLLSYHIPARSLCSSNTNLLLVSQVHTTFASLSFRVAAYSVWNSLPSGIHACSSSRTFRHILITIVLIRPSVPLIGSHKCLKIRPLAAIVHFKRFYLLAYLVMLCE